MFSVDVGVLKTLEVSLLLLDKLHFQTYLLGIYEVGIF